MTTSKYKVGDVLYVLDSENMRVIPVQVVTETVKRTLAGEELTYEIVTPREPDKPISLDRILETKEVFSSLLQVHDLMIRHATSSIDGIIQKAGQAARKYFNQDPLKLEDPLKFEPDETPDDEPVGEKATVTLPTGETVSVSLPPMEHLSVPAGVQNGAPVK